MEVVSRGLVVLFPEPYNAKLADILKLHGVPYEEGVSHVFDIQEVTDNTLLITMSSMEKIKMVEDYAIEDDMPYGQEQLIYQIKGQGEVLGLTVNNVGRQLRAAFDGRGRAASLVSYLRDAGG